MEKIRYFGSKIKMDEGGNGRFLLRKWECGRLVRRLQSGRPRSIFILRIRFSASYPFFLVNLFIIALLTACGGSPTAVANNPASPNDAATSQDTTATDQSSPATNQDNALGTEEYGLSKEGLVTSIETVEALIATCMSDAGFEYIAADYNTVRRGMVADKSLPGLSEKGYFDQYGFGIATLYTGLPPQLADETTPAQIGLGEKNVQIFKNLSPADQVAYNHTLLGENTNVTFAVAIETEDLSRTGGCTRAAIEQVFSPEQLTSTYLNPKDSLIEQDPRMVQAMAGYAECIRAAGFDYNHEREIEPDLRNRLAEITDGLPLEALSADALAALQELQTYERALAVASYDCEVRVLEPVEDQVERELFAGRQQ